MSPSVSAIMTTIQDASAVGSIFKERISQLAAFDPIRATRFVETQIYDPQVWRGCLVLPRWKLNLCQYYT